jgi:hypothetical protein
MNDHLIKISLAPVTIFYSYLPEKTLSIIEIPCLFKTIFECECPGCGITRGVKNLLHLQLDVSLEYHKLSIILLFLIFYVSVSQVLTIYKKYSNKSKNVRIYNI